MTSAMSSASPQRLRGISAAMSSISPGTLARFSSQMAVAMSPGLIALTRIPFGPQSAARARDIASTAPLVAA